MGKALLSYISLVTSFKDLAGVFSFINLNLSSTLYGDACMDHWSSFGSNLTSKENVWSGDKKVEVGRESFLLRVMKIWLLGCRGSLVTKQSFERDPLVVLAFVDLTKERSWGVEKEIGFTSDIISLKIQFKNLGGNSQNFLRQIRKIFVTFRCCHAAATCRKTIIYEFSSS